MSQIEHTLRMASLEAKEKELHTIVIDGFSEMRAKFSQVDEQIDFLAVELVTRTDRLEKRMEKMDRKLDLILNALAVNL